MVISACVVAGCGLLAEHRKNGDPDWIVHDVNVVDVESGTVHPRTSVSVKDGHIVAVSPASSVMLSSGTRIIDGQGRFLIPGLWDMHSHSLWSPQVLRTFLPLYVANGVTGIRDMGGRLDILAQARAAARDNRMPVPAIIAAGQMLDGSKPVHPEISIPAADAPAAVAAVGALADAGADFIKTYTLLPREAYFQVLAEAKRRGLPVAGHVPAKVGVEEAARAGQRSIEHLREEIAPFCSSSTVEDCARLAEVFLQAGTWQVPTLVTLRSKAEYDAPGLTVDPKLKYLPGEVRADWLRERESKLKRGPAYLAGRKKLFAEEVWLTRYLIGQGVGILAGTDAGVAFCYPGFSLHDELQELVDAGMTPVQALRAATILPAEFLGARESRGSIAPGGVADMVLLRANPLERIAATREIDLVVLRGQVFDRKALDLVLSKAEAEAQRP